MQADFVEAEALWGIKLEEGFLDLHVESAMIRHHAQWISISLRTNDLVSNQDKQNIERFDEAKRKIFKDDLEIAARKAISKVEEYLDPQKRELWLSKR